VGNAGVPNEGDGGQSNVGHNDHITNRPLPTEGDGQDMIQVTDGGGGLPDEIEVQNPQQ